MKKLFLSLIFASALLTPLSSLLADKRHEDCSRDELVNRLLSQQQQIDNFTWEKLRIKACYGAGFFVLGALAAKIHSAAK